MTTDPFSCCARVLAHQPSKWDESWLQIHGFWLVISKKMSGPAHFILPLDLVLLASGEPDTNIQNSLVLETSPESGSHKLFLSVISRVDIIQLFEALHLGSEYFQATFQSGKFRDEVDCEYQFSSGFVIRTRERRKLVLRSDSLIVGDPKQYPLHSIISMTPKQGDQTCGTKLAITVQTQDGTQQREFTGLVPNEMMRIYATFLMHAKAKTWIEQRRVS